MKKISAVILLIVMPVFICAGYFQNIEDYLKGYNKKYFIYVNRGLKRLYLVDNKLKVWKSYVVATGAKNGDKIYRGDNKTPAGVYKIKEINQYHEPWYLKQLRNDLIKYQKDSGRYRFYRDHYKKMKYKTLTGRKKIESLNSVYLYASQGHKKYGTTDDLGDNAYGSGFMLLDYPNKLDMKKYRAALVSGRVPVDANGDYLPPGSGIAIHGTNDNPSLGFDASSGCVRMLNEDLVEISNYVSEGTMVVID